MVGLLVCWSVDWKYGPSVVGLPAGLFVIWSVGRSFKASDRLAIQQTTDCLTIHTSIYLTAEQPTKDSSSTTDQCLNLRYRGFDVSPFLSGWLAAVGLTDSCLQVAGQIWGVFYLASLGDMPLLASSLNGDSPDRSENTPRGELLCHVMYHYLYSHIVNTLHC